MCWGKLLSFVFYRIEISEAVFSQQFPLFVVFGQFNWRRTHLWGTPETEERRLFGEYRQQVARLLPLRPPIQLYPSRSPSHHRIVSLGNWWENLSKPPQYWNSLWNLIDWLFIWLIDWLIVSLIAPSIDWLIEWSTVAYSVFFSGSTVEIAVRIRPVSGNVSFGRPIRREWESKRPLATTSPRPRRNPVMGRPHRHLPHRPHTSPQCSSSRESRRGCPC